MAQSVFTTTRVTLDSFFNFFFFSEIQYILEMHRMMSERIECFRNSILKLDFESGPTNVCKRGSVLDAHHIKRQCVEQAGKFPC